MLHAIAGLHLAITDGMRPAAEDWLPSDSLTLIAFDSAGASTIRTRSSWEGVKGVEKGFASSIASCQSSFGDTGLVVDVLVIVL